MKVRIDIQDMRFHAAWAKQDEENKTGDGRIPIRHELLTEIANCIEHEQVMIARLIEAGNALNLLVEYEECAEKDTKTWRKLAAEWKEGKNE